MLLMMQQDRINKDESEKNIRLLKLITHQSFLEILKIMIFVLSEYERAIRNHRKVFSFSQLF